MWSADSPLPSIASTVLLLLTLAGLTVVFHFVVRRVRSLHTRRTGLGIEYCWLGLTVLGLVGTVGQVRMTISAGRTLFTTESMNAVKTDLARDAHSAEVLFDSTYRYESWVYNRQDIPRFRAFGRWARQLRILTRDSLTDPAWKSLAAMASESAAGEPRVVRDYKEDLQREIRSLLKRAADVAELERAAHRNAGEELLFIFSPWFVAIGLALRITKATADYRGYFRDASPHAAADPQRPRTPVLSAGEDPVPVLSDPGTPDATLHDPSRP